MKKYKVTFRYIDGNFREHDFSRKDVDNLVENVRELRPGATIDFGFSDNSVIFIRWDYVTEIEITEVSDE